jgi:hypothetical protein
MDLVYLGFNDMGFYKHCLLTSFPGIKSFLDGRLAKKVLPSTTFKTSKYSGLFLKNIENHKCIVVDDYNYTIWERPS